MNVSNARARALSVYETRFRALKLTSLALELDTSTGEYRAVVVGPKGRAARSSSLLEPNLSEMLLAALDDYEAR